MSKLTDFVPCPSKDSINTGRSACPTAELVARFGKPRKTLSDDCQPVTEPFWARRMVMGVSVGPFKVSGHRLAIELLRKTLLELKARDPEVHAAIGTAGMLCCRRVRGAKSLSNHGLGLAVDLTIGGKLDVRGDDQVQVGMLRAYKVFKDFGWYWGAEFGTEDAMHFEVSAEKVQEWIDAGSF